MGVATRGVGEDLLARGGLSHMGNPGAKSGLPRTNPMMYLPDEHNSNRVYVFASAAGADRNPARFGNIRARSEDLTAEIDPRGSARKPKCLRSQLAARSSSCRQSATQASPATRP